MRRTPYTLGATAVGLAALFSFHSRSGLSGGPASTGTGGATTASPASSTTTTAPASSSTTTAPPTSSSVTSSPPTTAAGTASARTAEGKLENYGYGQLRVQATVKAGKLTALKVLTLRTADTYSQRLAVDVIPMLGSQAKKVQSARIYGITGATYTSQAYALSLQSALDSLHFR